MRFQFIACKIMQREAYLCAARSKNTIDLVLMEKKLHEALECTCDVQGRRYDVSLLCYGLCSNGIVGLSAKIPVVVPRGHDCITLLLGSKEKYQEYFNSHQGVFWYSNGWIEADDQPGKERYERKLEEYKQKYGEDNAQYLMEMEEKWIKEYNWATYIDWGLPTSDADKDYTKQCAEFLGWNYDEIKGDSSLMQKLIDGNWDQRDFLVIKPGQKIAEDINETGIIKAEIEQIGD